MSGHLPRSKPVTQESVDESDDEDEEESSEPVYVAKDSSRIAKVRTTKFLKNLLKQYQ